MEINSTNIDSEFSFSFNSSEGYFVFSNSGRRGEPKDFCIGKSHIQSLLNDINENFDVFIKHLKYVEKDWRDLGSNYFSENANRTLSTVQTKPLFVVLSKIFRVANDIVETNDEYLELSKENLINAINWVEKLDVVDNSNSHIDSTELTYTSPFMILAGISGTGKSRFVKKQAQASSKRFSLNYQENFCLVPVRPDWHEPSDLLGYISRMNGTKYISTKFLKFLVKAWVNIYANGGDINNLPNESSPYWLCLDEMNLAPVEQYFADYLSILETREISTSTYKSSPLLELNFLGEIDEELFWQDLGITSVARISTKKKFENFLLDQNKTNATVLNYLNAINKLVKKYIEFNSVDQFDIFTIDTNEAILIAKNFNLKFDINNELSFWASKESQQSGNGAVSAVAASLVDFFEQPIISNNDIIKDFKNHGGIPIPPNLIVAGTVNMDETTHGFSRKVLDRAMSLDFNAFYPNDYDAFFEDDVKVQAKTLTYSTTTQVTKDELKSTVDLEGKKTIAFLKSINEILKQTPFELAFRALNQALLMVKMWGQGKEDNILLAAIWDDFLMTKVLPRIEGDEQKIDEEDKSVLKKLESALQNNEIFKEIWEGKKRPDLLQESVELGGDNKPLSAPYIECRSRIKLKWMIERMERGYTSFWA